MVVAEGRRERRKVHWIRLSSPEKEDHSHKDKQQDFRSKPSKKDIGLGKIENGHSKLIRFSHLRYFKNV